MDKMKETQSNGHVIRDHANDSPVDLDHLRDGAAMHA
jgi:hypothetical protein